MVTLLLLVLGCGEDKDSSAGPFPSEVDTDGDGSVDGLDCAPDDPDVYPGAPDMPYDGVDADCEGDDDYDYDGDGYAGDGGGGDDCDDGNPEVHPGAIERCYNEFDEDCDGVWTDSSDCDGDGYDMSHDCWDEPSSPPEGAAEAGFEAADIHPDAEDAWYDGVDADCETDDDYDQDVDGESSAAELDGGVDCDDLDPAVNTQADEAWNGIDDDCEGTTDALSSRDETGSWFGDNYIGEDWFGADFDTVADLDGDGLRDLVVGVPFSNESDGRAYVLSWSEGLSVPADVALATIDGSGSYLGFAVQTLEDGAGGEIVAIGALGASAAYIFDRAALVGGDGLGGGDAVGSLSSAYAGYVLGEWEDGDGVDHLISGSYADMKKITEGTVVIADAPTLAAGGAVTDAMAVWTWTAEMAPTDVASLGDLDGDGLAEVGIGHLNALGGVRSRYVTGAEILAGGLPSTDALTGFSGSVRFGGPFDADGDGTVDVVVSDPEGGASGYGALRLVLADAMLAGGDVADVAFATYEGEESGAAVAGARRHGDVDDDGEDDLVVLIPGDGLSGLQGKIRLLSASTVAAGGSLSLGDGTPSWTGSNPNDQFGYDVLPEDIDADGDLDLWVSAIGDSGAMLTFLHD